MDGAGLIRTGVVEGHEEQALAKIRVAVVVQIVVPLIGKVIALAPAGVLLAAGELVVDVHQVGNGGALKAVHGVAQGVIVAFFHPGVLAGGAADLALGQVVAGEVDDGDTHAGENVGVSELQLAGRALVVAVGKHHALLRAKTGKSGEGGQVPVVKSVAHHAFLPGEIEIAGLDAPVAIGRVPPIVDLADPADEKFRKNQGTVALDVVLVHLAKIHPGNGSVLGAIEAAFFEVSLDVVGESLVSERLALVGEAEEILVDVLGGVETDAVIVHGVAQPVDPADNELAGVLVWKGAGGMIGIFFVITRVTDKRRRVGRVAGGIRSADLKPVGELENDIHEADQLLVKRAARAVIGIPLPHALCSFVATGLGSIRPDVKILRHHARVGAEIRTVTGVIEDDVGVDFEVRLVGVVDEVAKRGAGTITGFPMASLGLIAEIETVEGVIPYVASIGVRVRPADG